jgi:hypothetical protein
VPRRRRRDTIEEALGHAVDVMAEGGVGSLTVSEVARRMGVDAFPLLLPKRRPKTGRSGRCAG